MRQKILTAVVVVAIVMAALLVGDWGFITLLLGVLSVAAYELYHLVKEEVKPFIFPLMLVPLLVTPFVDMYQLIAVVCAFLLLLSLVSVLTNWFTLDVMSIIFLSSTLVMFAVYTAVNIFRTYGYDALIWVLLGNFMTDTMAYFIGIRYGAHKMIPKVSPNKTWEGAVGGYFGGLIAGLLFGYFFMQGKIPLDFIVLASLLMPITSQIGDLFFSKIKRTYGIKDFGTLLPSHGGILDRIDSLVFTLLLFMLLKSAWGIF